MRASRFAISVIPAKAGIQRLSRASMPRHWIPASAGMTHLWPNASLDERTASFAHRTERLVGGNRREHLVVVPRRLRFRRLLHLDQVCRMQRASVDADRALAEQRVVGRHLLHLVDDRNTVGVAF